MGGYFSGRRDGRPTVEDGLTVDLALMMRRGWIGDGRRGRGSLHWSCNGEPRSSIGYSYDMTDPDEAWLRLTFTWTPAGREARQVKQHVRLSFTVPNYGGRRWWMHCPATGRRVAKLHLPPGGGEFASREAWRLGYRSQRVGSRDVPFERLFRLQRKLGCDEGWEAGLRRPKGMWSRTFERHWEQYWDLDAQCSVAAMRMLGRL
jgi:hypothetical protein